MFSPSYRRPSAIIPPTRHSAIGHLANPESLDGPGARPALDLTEFTLRDLERRFRAFMDTAATVERKSLSTLHGYRGAFQNFSHFLRSELRSLPATLGTRVFAIEAWVGWNNARGISAVTTNHYWRSLRPFFCDLERRDGVQNPFRGMRPPVLPKVLPKARSEEECRRILLAAENYPWAHPFDRALAVAIFGVLIYAGLRRGEVCRLAFTDVDLETGTIRIRQGKGIGGGKDRTAYVAPELRELLDDYLRERRRAGVIVPGFFASRLGSASLSDSTLVRIVRRVRAASGVPFSIHSLRHSFVTMLLRSGVPIHVARDLAGHASIVTTAGYLRVWDDEKRRNIGRLSLRG